MVTQLPDSAQPEVLYPETDGQPMADNTEQFNWIVLLKEGLELLFADQADVFVAGDLLWYPVQGDNQTCAAADVLVVFGRPKGRRGSYQQWQEDNLAPQVVFEVLSPGNRPSEMAKKFVFYDRYGVEECYLYDPDRVDLTGWQRAEGQLQLIDPLEAWVSPRLGIRFELTPEELHLYRPDGQRFATYVELARQRAQAEHRAEQAEHRVQALEAHLRTLGIDPQTLS